MITVHCTDTEDTYTTHTMIFGVVHIFWLVFFSAPRLPGRKSSASQNDSHHTKHEKFATFARSHRRIKLNQVENVTGTHRNRK